jgi:acetolactate synthase-1/2/3 large subunit
MQNARRATDNIKVFRRAADLERQQISRRATDSIRSFRRSTDAGVQHARRATDKITEFRRSTDRNLDIRENGVYQMGDLLLSYLKQIDVEYVFGIPGGAIEPLYDAIARDQRKGGIRSIVARHETGAAFMCDGYTSNSGVLGVVAVTTGPGSTNLTTGVASAYANQIPMLIITAQTAIEDWGKGGFQESSSSMTGVDTVRLFEPITRFNYVVTHISQFEQLLVTAIRRAYESPRGPVHLSIPSNIFKANAPVSKPSYDLAAIPNPPAHLDEQAFDELCDILTSGYRIAFILGEGCARAMDEVLEVATLLNIEIVTTPHGKGLVSPYHPLHRGVIGFAGHETAGQLVNNDEVRFIVVIGARFGEWDSNRWHENLHGKRLIHIAADSGFFARTPGARMHVRGSIKAIFVKFLEYLESNNFRKVSTNTPAKLHSVEPMRQAAKPTRSFKLDDEKKYKDDSTPLKPQRLMKLLARKFPHNTKYLADIGASFAWAIHYLHPYKWGPSHEQSEQNSAKEIWPGVFRTCLEFSSMGWAQGAAIGTGFACKGDPVVCITGDGSCLMSGAELTVALQHNLSVIFVVLNDSSYGMVEHGQRLTGAESIGTELPEVSYAKIARAMGIDAYTIRCTQDLLELDVDEITTKRSPTVLDCLIDKAEVPPIGLRTNALKNS